MGSASFLPALLPLLTTAVLAGPTSTLMPSSTPFPLSTVEEGQLSVSGGSTASGDVLRRLADNLNKRTCHQQHQTQADRHLPRLRKIMIFNRTAVCNDGSPSGYYIRKSYGSRRWLVFLEGGWFCFDKSSCDSRWIRMRNLMSSKGWPDFKHVGGILSSDAEENPFWWNANHVYVPYCSSDSWSGLSPAKSRGEFAFMGSLILQEVIKDLLHRGLADAQFLLLAGSSAGGTGVLMNLDRMVDLMRSLGLFRVEVRGLSDSGWFLDNEPYESMTCTHPHSCAPIEAAKLGIRTWNGQVPDRCKTQYPLSEHWRCYFGYRLYPTLKAPVFVFQWLFDEAQMTADNVGAPVTKQQWDYIHKMGYDLRSTLKNVTAVFAPSCISHIVLTKRDWLYVKVNHVSLPQALRCWELQKQENNHVQQHHHHNHHHHTHNSFHHNHHHRQRYEEEIVQPNENNSSQTQMLADMPEALIQEPPLGLQTEFVPNSSNSTTLKNNRRNRMGKRKHRRQKKKRRKNHDGKRRKRKHGDKKGGNNNHKGRIIRSSLFSSQDDPPWKEVPPPDNESGVQVCSHWLIDECSWPQCNRACPRLHNPFTGEEMDFIELLKSFGLDMVSVANALGIDLATLNEMDNDTLLQLLTQQTN